MHLNIAKATIYNDDYSGTVVADSRSNKWLWVRHFNFGSIEKERVYSRVTMFVPKLIKQTVSFTDEKGKTIVDVNGRRINSIVQYGLTGQPYTSAQPELILGYYNEHYLRIPENAKEVMSEFGIIGSKYTRSFHDGYRTVFTEIDNKGTMEFNLYNSKNPVVYHNSGLPKNSVINNAYIKTSGGSSTVLNPYVEQTRNVDYKYAPLGKLVPDVPGSEPVRYPNGTDRDALYREVKQMVKYVDEQGNSVASNFTDKVSFNRIGTIDQVTGEVTYSNLVAKDNDDIFNEKKSPVVDGYYTDRTST